MREDYAAFRALGAEVLVVTRHEVETMRAYWREHELPYLGVADPRGEITRRYRQQWRLFKLGRMPALFVVDRQGQLALAHYGANMTDIPSDELVLGVMRELEARR